ncbi:hypothetical protein T07_14734 [Trichinella nelsoni]|uniref:Uncharacterized protein n=1 Tax=Trichinella nelsoni TaxID=6336 RepID=A0A0V0SL67_9BILA|nr:hypothetical protein T07_14734 [Trichinella nelsoni]
MSMSVRRHFDDVIDWSLLAAYHLSDQQISLCSLLVNVATLVTVSSYKFGGGAGRVENVKK